MKYVPALPQGSIWDMYNFNVKLLESSEQYVQDCLRVGKPLDVQDFFSWHALQEDLAEQERNRMNEIFPGTLENLVALTVFPEHL